MSNHLTQRYSSTEFTKYLAKIRSTFDSIKVVPDRQDSGHSSRRRPEYDEDELFGKIEKKDLEKILEAYERQQQSKDLLDKPVTCGVFGRSYQKLLFSRPGFHHLGSTDYLISQIGINDVERNCFLAGISSFSDPPDEDIRSLTIRQNQALAETFARRAQNFLMKGDDMNCRLQIEKAFKKDPNCARAHSVQAKLHVVKKQFPEAIESFKKSIDNMRSPGCTFDYREKEQVRLDISDALYELGLKHYHRADDKGAIPLFNEALYHNQNNGGAKFHRELSQDRLASKPRFSSSQVKPAYRR